MKKTILITTLALSSFSFAQEDVNFEEPWESNSSRPQFFIGGSYGFASDTPEQALNVSDSLFVPSLFGITPANEIDAIGFDNMASFELGFISKLRNNVSFILSAEFLWGGAENSLSNASVDIDYDADNYAFLINGKLAYDINPYASIYLGGGIGTLRSELTINDSYFGNVYAEEDIFIWQGAAGIEVKPVEQLGIFVQYRYLSGADFEQLNFTAISDSFVDVGARFYF